MIFCRQFIRISDSSSALLPCSESESESDQYSPQGGRTRWHSCPTLPLAQAKLGILPWGSFPPDARRSSAKRCHGRGWASCPSILARGAISRATAGRRFQNVVRQTGDTCLELNDQVHPVDPLPPGGPSLDASRWETSVPLNLRLVSLGRVRKHLPHFFFKKVDRILKQSRFEIELEGGAFRAVWRATRAVCGCR